MILGDPEQICNIMLDLETMGVTNSAPVLAIGAVEVGTTEVELCFYTQVKPQGVAEFSTIAWWLGQAKQNPEAADEIIYAINKGSEVVDALRGFGEWVRETAKGREVCIWGNGASFDEPIIRALMDANDVFVPWSFRRSRCYRTIVAAFGDVVPKPEQVGVSHNALSDARWQAEYLHDIDLKIAELNNSF